MTYERFRKWFDEKASDGLMTKEQFLIGDSVINDMDHTSFWKRKKKWANIEQYIVSTIVWNVEMKAHRLTIKNPEDI